MNGQAMREKSDWRKYNPAEINGLSLRYAVIRTPTCDDEENDIFSILCVLADKYETDDYEFIYDVTRNEQRAEEIVDILRNGGVTPCAVRDVLADIL